MHAGNLSDVLLKVLELTEIIKKNYIEKFIFLFWISSPDYILN